MKKVRASSKVVFIGDTPQMNPAVPHTFHFSGNTLDRVNDFLELDLSGLEPAAVIIFVEAIPVASAGIKAARG